MEYIFIHTPNGNYGPEVWPALLEMGKKLLAKPEEVVPGGKLIAVYSGRTKLIIVCLWEAPSIDSFMPVLDQMAMFGWDTDIIPAEKMNIRLEKLGKAMEEMAKK